MATIPGGRPIIIPIVPLHELTNSKGENLKKYCNCISCKYIRFGRDRRFGINLRRLITW